MTGIDDDTDTPPRAFDEEIHDLGELIAEAVDNATEGMEVSWGLLMAAVAHFVAVMLADHAATSAHSWCEMMLSERDGMALVLRQSGRIEEPPEPASFATVARTWTPPSSAELASASNSMAATLETSTRIAEAIRTEFAGSDLSASHVTAALAMFIGRLMMHEPDERITSWFEILRAYRTRAQRDAERSAATTH